MVCTLCPHTCRIAAGEAGVCGVRRNVDGELRTDVYGVVATAQPAPIERKYLFHVAPGTRAFSFAPPGCNLRCRYCQNWMVSQVDGGDAPALAGRPMSPEQIVAAALDAGCEAVACTYTEPTIFYEFALEVAKLARQAGLRNVWKTNGYIAREPQEEILPYLDAVNVDLKSLREKTYRRVMSGRLQPVLDALVRFRAAQVWIEVTTLVIPTVTDSARELDEMALFIRYALGPDTPWHLTRFHPDYELRHLPPTPAETLHAARERALAAGLKYVYTDTAARGPGCDTHCHACGAAVIERSHFRVTANRLEAGRCHVCKAKLAGVAVAGL